MSVATVIFGLNGLAWRADFRCAHYMYHGQTANIYIFAKKLMEKSAFPTRNA